MMATCEWHDGAFRHFTQTTECMCACGMQRGCRYNVMPLQVASKPKGMGDDETQ